MISCFRSARFTGLHRRFAWLAGTLLLGLCCAAQADDISDADQLFKQGHAQEALDKINGYLVNKPRDAQARFLKGLILTQQGKTADAIEVFSALTTDYPDLPEPYNNLAVLYAEQGNYEKARVELEMAIRTHPSYATAHENLGDIYAKMASQAYDRALKLDRNNTSTQTKLAMIQELFAGGSPHKETSDSARDTEEVAKPAAPDQPAVPAGTATPMPPAQSQSPSAAAAEPAPQDSNAAILKTINDWAAAWSSQDVDKYLSFYASDFKTPDGMGRADWEAMRRERISAPKHIEVGVKILTIQLADNSHATAKFRQSYRASHLRANGTKTLMLARSGDKWLIEEELSR